MLTTHTSTYDPISCNNPSAPLAVTPVCPRSCAPVMQARSRRPQHPLAELPVPRRRNVGRLRPPLAPLPKRVRCRSPSGPPRRPVESGSQKVQREGEKLHLCNF
eukprot:4676883-Prymnesium_polylepis.1